MTDTGVERERVGVGLVGHQEWPSLRLRGSRLCWLGRGKFERNYEVPDRRSGALAGVGTGVECSRY